MWKIIENTNYQVSESGLIQNMNTGRILKAVKDNRGYCSVYLSINGKEQRYLIHRLVADAFIPNPDNLPIINHKDENPSNNNVDNLEWCNHSYNTTYGTCQERRKLKITNHKNLSKPVNQFSISGEFIKQYPSAMEVKRQTGFDNSHVSQCCNGRLEQAYGYIWKYVN